MDDDLMWWMDQQRPCPTCGGAGIPIVMDMQDMTTRDAVINGLATLAGCGLGGAADGNDRECTRCGLQWSSRAAAAVPQP